uniref:Putative tigger transposase n=1 Tax=Ixodes ricinus TaxID=34613 RepID=A0A6B0V6J3_IXORI
MIGSVSVIVVLVAAVLWFGRCDVHRPKMPKYKSLTLKQKICLIEEANKSTCSKTKLAEKHQVPISTLCTILKNQARIIEAYSKTHSAKRSRIRFPIYPDVEAALITWLQNATAAHLPIDGTILREKANDLALKLGHEEFKCSNGWFSRFKERNNLTYLTVCGESGSADKTVVEDWIKHTLTPLLSKYSAEDVYNLDEAALFYKMLPTKTFAAKDADVKGQKQAKDRITVLFGANMTGEHKLPLLVLGKAEKPRCFKIARLPPANELIYRNNKKAWVTAAIFAEYVRLHDCKFAAAG